MNDPQQPTVLIVDDSDDCAETLEMALHSLPDVRVDVVHSAEEALDRINATPLAALVTDLHLPQMDGLQLLSALRAQRSGSRTPVVVVSGDSDPRTPARVIAAGAQAFFAKPYSPSAVRRKLEELLSESGRNRNGSPD